MKYITNCRQISRETSSKVFTKIANCNTKRLKHPIVIINAPPPPRPGIVTEKHTVIDSLSSKTERVPTDKAKNKCSLMAMSSI